MRTSCQYLMTSALSCLGPELRYTSCGLSLVDWWPRHQTSDGTQSVGCEGNGKAALGPRVPQDLAKTCRLRYGLNHDQRGRGRNIELLYTVHTFVVADEDNGANAPILAAECIRFVDQLAVSWVVEDMHALFGN